MNISPSTGSGGVLIFESVIGADSVTPSTSTISTTGVISTEVAVAIEPTATLPDKVVSPVSLILKF